MLETPNNETVNFIEAIINKDNESGKYGKRVHTRFPPEPNGYLHIGHAKSICLNFGLGNDYNGLTNLRFDDTNPSKEEVEYVKSIEADVKWLGFDWDDREYFASDYFDTMYEYAKELIKKAKPMWMIRRRNRLKKLAAISVRRAPTAHIVTVR